MYHNLLIHSVVDECLGYFQFGVMNKAAMNIFTPVFWGYYALISLSIYIEVKWLSHREYASLTLVDTVKHLAKVVLTI